MVLEPSVDTPERTAHDSTPGPLWAPDSPSVHAPHICVLAGTDPSRQPQDGSEATQVFKSRYAHPTGRLVGLWL